MPYDCGLALIRNEALHRATFAARPLYLKGQTAGLAGGEPWFCDYGIDLSRGNPALKVWAAIEAFGADRLGAAITNHSTRSEDITATIAAVARARQTAVEG